MRAALLALALGVAAPAVAQETPAPRTDIAVLRKEAKADPAIRKALADKTRTMDSRLRDDGRMVDLILSAAAAKPGERVLDIASGGGYLGLLLGAIGGESVCVAFPVTNR